MNLIFIYGPPASGKYTVSKTLSELTGYKLFHNHLTYDLAYSLFGDDVYSIAFKECCEKLRLTAINEAIRYDVDLIFTFVYDNKSDYSFVQELTSFVRDSGGTVYFICLNPSLDIIEKRVIEDSRKVFKKVSTLDELTEFKKHYNMYSIIPNVESFTIDNSYIKPEEVARKIIKHIKD